MDARELLLIAVVGAVARGALFARPPNVTYFIDEESCNLYVSWLPAEPSNSNCVPKYEAAVRINGIWANDSKQCLANTSWKQPVPLGEEIDFKVKTSCKEYCEDLSDWNDVETFSVKQNGRHQQEISQMSQAISDPSAISGIAIPTREPDEGSDPASPSSGSDHRCQQQRLGSALLGSSGLWQVERIRKGKQHKLVRTKGHLIGITCLLRPTPRPGSTSDNRKHDGKGPHQLSRGHQNNPLVQGIKNSPTVGGKTYKSEETTYPGTVKNPGRLAEPRRPKPGRKGTELQCFSGDFSESFSGDQ